MKRVNITITNGEYSYSADMSSARNVIYSQDMTYCLCESDLQLPLATTTDIDGTKTQIEIDEAYNDKVEEILVYADGLINLAYCNPQSGVFVNTKKHKDKVNRRRSKRSDKLAKGQTLTQKQLNDLDLDDVLSDYEDTISDDADNAIDALELLTSWTAIINFDVSAQSWTSWTAPN